MPDQSQSAIVREWYAALEKGEVDRTAQSLLADDAVFHVPGRGPLNGDYQGRGQVMEYLRQLSARTGGTLIVEPETILPSGEFVTVLIRAHGNRDGRVLDDTGVHLFRIQEDRIVERWSFTRDLYAVDEFFA